MKESGHKNTLHNSIYIKFGKKILNYGVKAKDGLEKNKGALKKSKEVITKELLLGKGIWNTSEVMTILSCPGEWLNEYLPYKQFVKPYVYILYTFLWVELWLQKVV